jgi:GNAT superfamily N-acetyltransferase
MNIFRAQNALGLADIRIKYLREDFPEMTDAEAAKIKARLPRYYADHLNCDLFAYLAEDGGKLVGSAFLTVREMPPNPNFPRGRVGTVLNVFTEADYRRQGIATELMELLIKDAKTMELDYIELQASEDGYPLYRKLGFEDKRSPFTPMKLVIKE